MSRGKRCRTVAVEDCNDDDQSNGVNKGKVRVLGAFRNLSKCVGSRNGNSGSGSLIGIKFELDFLLPRVARRAQSGGGLIWVWRRAVLVAKNTKNIYESLEGLLCCI
jgi:hypothetical protein